MNKEEYKKQEEKELDEEYAKFLSSWLTIEEVIERDRKQSFAIELEEQKKYKENTSKILKQYNIKYKKVWLK